MAFFSWMKRNKLATVLLVIVGYFLLQSISKPFLGTNLNTMSLDNASSGVSSYGMESPSVGSTGKGIAPSSERSTSIMPPIAPDYAPSDSKDRLVVQDSYLSLLVKDVTDTRAKIVKHASDAGGYMVNSSVNNPQDAPTSTVIVRIPSTKLEEALTFYRSLSVKVVSENLNGQDVTDQYVDIDTRIEQLEKTKTRLEEILDKATLVSDITNVTQQILSYQNQIDSLKGQQDALKKNAQLTKITLYLSTDEIALPYAPSETFRPAVIFKLAVRSLVTTLRGLATNLIWLAVYAVIWVPLVIAYVLLRKWWTKRKKVESTNTFKN